MRPAAVDAAGGEVGGAGGRTRVLLVDEHRPPVRGGDHAGRFLADRAGHEATNLAGDRICDQHGVIAEGRQIAPQLFILANIGLDPETAISVEPKPIRAGEHIVGPERRAVHGAAIALGACDDKQVPGEARCGMVVIRLAPADDLAELIARARIGRFHLRLGAAGVVGQGKIDPAVAGINGTPFRTIHLGRADRIGGKARIHQHLALVGEAVGGGQRADAVLQRQPLARAIGIELGDVKNAVV